MIKIRDNYPCSSVYLTLSKRYVETITWDWASEHAKSIDKWRSQNHYKRFADIINHFQELMILTSEFALRSWNNKLITQIKHISRMINVLLKLAWMSFCLHLVRVKDLNHFLFTSNSKLSILNVVRFWPNLKEKTNLLSEF
jgi:hypothetical protein